MSISEPIKVHTEPRTSEMLTACLYDLIRTSRGMQPYDVVVGWTIGDTIAQATQELGEFSEQVMISAGKIPHKEAEYNGIAYEAADVIICVIDAYTKQHPDESPAALLQKLSAAIDKKSEKWKVKVAKQVADKLAS